MNVNITFSGISLNDLKSMFIEKKGVKAATFGISASTICNPNITINQQNNIYCAYNNVVRVTYNPKRIGCEELISFFINACVTKQPKDPIIFYHNRPQQITAEKLKDHYNYPYLSVKPAEMFWEHDIEHDTA